MLMAHTVAAAQAHVTSLTFEVVEETYVEPQRTGAPLELSALPGLKSLTVRDCTLPVSCLVPRTRWPAWK